MPLVSIHKNINTNREIQARPLQVQKALPFDPSSTNLFGRFTTRLLGDFISASLKVTLF